MSKKKSTLKPYNIGLTPTQAAILKLLSGQNSSNAIVTLNYCISYISNSAVFTLHLPHQQGKVSSAGLSKGKV